MYNDKTKPHRSSRNFLHHPIAHNISHISCSKIYNKPNLLHWPASHTTHALHDSTPLLDEGCTGKLLPPLLYSIALNGLMTENLQFSPLHYID